MLLGATPNGIANMDSATEKYVYSKLEFFIVPMVGVVFIDFTNVAVITFFVNLFS